LYLVGSYSENSNSKSLYKIEYKDGLLKILEEVESGINPSFLQVLDGNILLINETDQRDNVRLIRQSGEVESTFYSGGVGPCHIHSFGSYTTISNYTSGTISLFKDNSLLDSYTFSGSGPNRERQDSSHVHSSVFCNYNSTLYSVDLGRDRVDSFKIENGSLKLISSFKLNPGDGPRMMIIKESLGYIVNELSNTLTVVDLKKGGDLEEVGRYSTLPNGYRGESYASHIDIYKDDIYISNRGYDSIVKFPIIGRTIGKPSWIKIRGTFPRHFLIDNGVILVANQESNTLEVINLNSLESITSINIFKPTVVSKLV
jgi:6-phosphogluconolactonase